MKTKLLVLILVLALSLSMGVSAQETINIAVPTDPDSLDPARAIAAATAEIAFNVYEGLVKSTSGGSVVGALATHWEIDETLTEYTFYLRDAYFHNGQKVTAEDVVYSLERARDPQTGVKAADFQAIKDVLAVQDAVKIILNEPYAPLVYELTELAAAIYPANSNKLASNPVGSGPYKFVEWKPNQYLKLTQFNQYWGDDTLYFEDVYFRIVPDFNSAVASIKTGNIDLIPRLDASYLHQVENDPRLNVISTPMNLVQILGVNNNRPALQDVRVRQALALAIDRDEIIMAAAWDQGQPLYTGMSPAMDYFYNAATETILPYNPQRAQELLAEAGYSDLRLVLELPAPYQTHIHTGEVIAEQLRQIGVTVELKIVEWGMWLDKIYNGRDYDLTIVGLTGKLDPHTILSRYTSDSGKNFTNFASEEYDQLIFLGKQVPEEERMAIYKQAQAIMTEQVAGIFIMDPDQLVITNNQIKGWRSYPVYVIDVAALYK